MSRRGIGAIKARQAKQAAAKKLGAEIESNQIQEMTSQLAEFKESLEAFAVKHKKEINSNPVFRNQFLKMCQQIGVDPLSSNKGFWVDVLGVGDFYYELAIQIVNICIATRKKNGGYLEEQECLRLLQTLRANKNTQDVTIDDMRKAVDSIQKLGSDFRILETGNKRVICSVAAELNADHLGVMKFADEEGGRVSYSSISRKMAQYADKDRFYRAIERLIQDGMAWEDTQTEGEVAYWFPSLMQGGQSESDHNEISGL